MALPFEAATDDARRAERESQRRILAAFPRNGAAAEFLATTGSIMLDTVINMQDAILMLQDDKFDAGLARLRQATADGLSTYGRIVMGARHSMAAVNEVSGIEEPIMGVDHNTARAIKSAAETSTFRTRSAFKRSFSDDMPKPVPAKMPRMDYTFPCDACGIMGHWKREGKCKPEDVAKKLQMLATAAALQAGVYIPPTNNTAVVNPQPGPSNAAPQPTGATGQPAERNIVGKGYK